MKTPAGLRIVRPKSVFGRSAARKNVPRYYLVQSGVLNRIEKGEYGPGDKIPTEKELASAFGVSIGTVKTALLNLVNSGLLFRVQGKGTFISGSMIGRDKLRLYHFVSDFEKQDAPLQIRFLSIQPVEGPAPVRGYLKLQPEAGMFRLDRIFTLQNLPVVYASSFLPRNVFKGLDRFPRETFEAKPLYRLIEDAYKLPTVRYQEMFAACRPAADIRRHLKVSPAFPLLSVEMLALTFQNRPIEYRVSYCRTDGVKLFRMPAYPHNVT